mgnify:CR=1 FL=1|jgi:hypothetical protein
MKVVRVKIDGTMDELKTKNTKSLKILENLAISKGTSFFKELYQWNSEGNTYSCYGWFDGDTGFENKHELIPNGTSSFLEEDSSEILLFGDIFITRRKNSKMMDLDISGYGEIFGILCGGFDDCNTSDEDIDESDEPDTEDEGFIVGDDEEIISNESEYSEEELDEDENEYSDESDGENDYSDESE